MDWIIISDQPLWSALIWALVALFALYVARVWVHRLLHRLSSALTSVLRFQAKALHGLAAVLHERTREVMLEQAKARLSLQMERDLHRLVITADRDLAQLPELKQRVRQHLERLESDYHGSAEQPVSAPDWMDAIDQVVRLRQTQSGHPVVSGVLKEMEASLNRQHKQSISEFRKGRSLRHRLLHGLLPQWRKLHHGLDRLTQIIEQLTLQSQVLERHLSEYREISSGSDRIYRRLLLSNTAQWLFASFALVAGIGLAWFNVQLMQAPLASLMGAEPEIAGLPLATLATVVLVFIYLLLGVLLFETVQLTQRFDVFAALTPLQRRTLLLSLLFIVTLIALAQSGLLYLRDQAMNPATYYEQLIQYPVIVIQSPLLDEWLKLGAVMLLGFVMPFILLFVVLPLDRWLDASRTLVAMVLVWFLLLVAFGMRFLALVIRQVFSLISSAYDVLISLPLWIEGRLSAKKTEPPSELPRDLRVNSQ